MRSSATPEVRNTSGHAAGADLQVLSQLIASIGILPALSATSKTAEFALEVLRTVYPGAACAACMRGLGAPMGDLPRPECPRCADPEEGGDRSIFPCALAAREDVRAFALRTVDSHYGYLCVRTTSGDASELVDRDPYVHNFANAVATTVENRWQRQELEQQNARLRDFGGELQRMVEQRTAELESTNDRLTRESHRSEVLLRNASDGIHILDQDGNVLEASDSFGEMLGYSREELLRANVSLWDARWTSPELKQRLVEMLRMGGQTAFETRHRCRDGRVIEVEITSRPVELDGRRVLFNSSRDISERKRAEDALRTSERRYHGLFDQANEGLIVMSLEGELLDVNKAFAEMHGYTTAEMRSMDIRQLDVLKEDTMRQREHIGRRIAAGETVRFDVEHFHRDGHIIPFNVTASIVDFGGRPCALAFHQDVTERRRLEQVHLQAQKLQALGTLTGGIAHDFNNLLAAIQGNAELAVSEVGPAHAAAESLREIRQATARASELVRRIMAFGRPAEPRPAIVDLGAVVGEVLNLLRATLPARITLTTNFAADAPCVLADAGQVHEAIVNLSTNAAHAIGPRPGSIAYRLEGVRVGEELARSLPDLRVGDYTRLAVRDDGCGMNAETLARSFDAFFTTKPAGEGTGLGLSMVHGIMKSHGGAVTVESTLGHGSVFTLYFPSAFEPSARELERPPEVVSSPVMGAHVLYVDDEAALVNLASRVLERRGYRVTTATSPEQALVAFRAAPGQFDVAVTDYSMPGMSGLELSRALLLLRPDLPILMTTGRIGSDEAHKARSAGIRDLLIKPFTMADLERALGRSLEQNQPGG